MAINKVVFGNTTLIDLTGDDVTASDVLSGKIFHLPSGVISTGTMENVKHTTKTITPYTTAKTYLPSDDGDYNYYTQVTVNAIAYTETDNAAGGKTVTIGTVAPS